VELSVELSFIALNGHVLQASSNLKISHNYPAVVFIMVGSEYVRGMVSIVEDESTFTTIGHDPMTFDAD
jgi:hypothetical protein